MSSEIVTQSPFNNAKSFRDTTQQSPTPTIQNILAEKGQGYDFTQTVTNYLLRTDDLSTGVWTRSPSMTVTVVSNDPAEYMIKNYSVVPLVSTVPTIFQTSQTLPAGTPAWFSIYLKAVYPITITIKLEEVGVGFVTLDCDVDTTWKYFYITRSWPNNVAAKISILPVLNEKFYVASPMLVSSVKRFGMYIPSTGTVGVYTKVQSVKRFWMFEQTTNVSATPMMETPDSTTAYMLENY